MSRPIPTPCGIVSLLVGLALLGCNGGSSGYIPSEEQNLSASAGYVLKFVEDARETPADAQANLAILMESLDAQAAQYPEGNAPKLRDAANECLSALNAATGERGVIQALDALEAKVRELFPQAKLPKGAGN